MEARFPGGQAWSQAEPGVLPRSVMGSCGQRNRPTHRPTPYVSDSDFQLSQPMTVAEEATLALALAASVPAG